MTYSVAEVEGRRSRCYGALLRKGAKLPTHTAKIFAASGRAIRRFAIPNPSIRAEVTDAAGYEPCDIAVVYGAVRAKGRDPDRIAVRNDIYSRHTGPLVVVETGFIGRQFSQPPSRLKSLLGIYQSIPSTSPYLRVGLGGAFGDDGDFCNENSPSDRWQRLQQEFNLTIEPWRTTGRHVLVIGQVPNDSSLKGANISQWLIETVRDLRTHTDRPIRVRLHPRMVKEEAAPLITAVKYTGAALSDPAKPIWEDLRQCWTCVTFSSSSSVEAIMAGVPAICVSPASIAYKVSSNSVSEIDHPLMLADREQWLSNLAFAQWNADEIASGAAWMHLEGKALSYFA